MCYVITVLFLVGLLAVSRKDWQTVRWAGNALVYLGMVGTVLGLIMTVSDLSVDKAQSFESFKAIVTAIYVGAGVALYTNLLACIGYLWLGTNAHLLARQLPWDEKVAKALQDAIGENERQHGSGVGMGQPFERSWDPEDPKFYALPQPKLPDKPGERPPNRASEPPASPARKKCLMQ
jgi:hypothetical protein